MTDTEAGKYWAFISYSHADARWATWLHRALEGYRIPARLVGRATPHGPVPKKLFPVFRDRDELAGSSELGPALQRALREARFQIVIASPNSARSRWVNEEIRYFKSLGRSTRVLALIVDGEPNATDKGQPALECFPEALRFQVDAQGRQSDQPAELIAADARKGADGKANALLKLIAGILGVGFNDLRQRELQARNRRLAILASIATAISAVTIVLAVVAYQARNDALRRQQQAEDLLQFMLGDLRDKLDPIGKLSILDAVGQKAMDYFATLDQKDLTDAALASRARALRQIGEVRIKQGDTQGATEAVREALRLDEALAARHPDDPAAIRAVGESEFSMGYAHYVTGEMDQALPWWTRRAATARRLLALEPANKEWQAIAIDADQNLGALAYARKDLDAAYQSFSSALTGQAALVTAEPDNQKHIEALASYRSWLCRIESDRRDWPKAIEHAEQRAAALRRLTELAPDNAQYQHRLAKANLQTLYVGWQLEPVAPDAPTLRETLQLTTALVELDPDNIEFAHTHMVALNYLVDAQLTADHFKAAGQHAEEVLDLARRTYRRAPASAVTIDDLLAVLAQSIKVAWLQGDRAAAAERLREAADLPLSEAQKQAVPASRWLDLALLDWQLAPRALPRLAAAADAWLTRVRDSGAPPKPELMLRYEALKGNRAEAARWWAQLSGPEREHPFVRRLCAAAAACRPATPAPATTAAGPV